MSNGATAHRLSDIDETAKTAVCSQCGPIKLYGIRKARNYECSNRAKARHKDNRAANTRQQLKYRLWKFYRLTPEDIETIDSFQRNHPVLKQVMGKRLSTDHDHKTGLIRGRLEWRLNRAYGLVEAAFPDNVAEVLRALADYHDTPPAIDALGKKTYGVLGKAQQKKKFVYGPPTEKGKEN